MRAQLASDEWAPYAGDGENAWVQIGTHQSFPVCRVHHDQVGGFGRPAWGNVEPKDPYEANYVLCSSDTTSGIDSLQFSAFRSSLESIYMVVWGACDVAPNPGPDPLPQREGV